MKVNIKKITISELFAEPNAYKLFDMYADESKSAHIKTPTNPSVKTYLAVEELGMIDAVASYSDNVMVGFIIAMTTVMPHYDKPSTTIESQYILKEYRKHGTWKKMMSMIEDIAKRKGSVNLFISAPKGESLDKVAAFNGYAHISNIYTKSIV